MEESHVVINDELVDPTGDFVKNYVFSLAKETPFLDYKLTISIAKDSDFPKFVKDAMAFANNGGGWIVLGIEENQYLDPAIKGKFIATGLSGGFHLEPATLQQKINSYLNSQIELDYDEFYKTVDGQERKFAIIYFKPSKVVLTAIKDGDYNLQDGTLKKGFVKDTVYTRRGTQSVPASALEIDWIKKRVQDENYRLSILSGEPDKVQETLYGNIFEIKKLPQYVFLGVPKFHNRDDIIAELKKISPNQYVFLKLRFYENRIVTLQDLTDSTNPYSNLAYTDQIIREPTCSWLENTDKMNMLVSLMNMEIIGKGIEQGMRYHRKTDKLFFSTEDKSREMSWPSKFKASRRTVAQKIFAKQLKQSIFFHSAINASIVRINDRFFLEINPTFIITTDGKQAISGIREGTIITRLSYNKYNDAQLNNVLFWINKLGAGDDVKILNDFIISSEPVQTSLDFGISWDVPTTEIKTMIENYKPEIEDVKFEEEYTSDEFMV